MLVAFTAPSATLEITLLPALIPAVVTLGPPVIVRPLVSNKLLPACTLVRPVRIGLS